MPKSKKLSKIIKKIIDNYGKFIIFYSPWCPYSINAIKLIDSKTSKYKAYEIDEEKGLGLAYILKNCISNAELLQFDCNHKTRPLIFYKKKFIGGYTELVEFLEHNKVDD